MEISVRVSRKRKCPASLDWKRDIPNGHWVLSFGDASEPATDVEVEFTVAQLEKLKELVNNAKKPEHSGLC